MCSAGLRPMRAATLAALQLLVLAAPACRADVDPDADPSRTPRVRAPPGGGPVAARAASNGGGVALADTGSPAIAVGGVALANTGSPPIAIDNLAVADSSPLAIALSLPPDPIQSLRCAGGSAIAFSLDASSSIVPVEFAEMQSEVSRFIVETDDQRITDNRNLYYANTFGTVLEDTTAGVSPGSPSFDPNEDNAVSDEVLGFTPSKGASDIGAGLRDLAAQFAGLDDPAYAGVAVLITDSTASKPGDLSAAVSQLKAATQAALGADVTVAVVGVGTFVDPAELRQIASVGADGSPLVYEINFFDDISLSLEEALLNIDSDGDGVDDCRDGCPADPGKTEPGSCGCGVPEGECATECRGLFAFSILTNICLGSDTFDAALDQVIQFVDESSGFASGPANPNIYYANAVNHRVHSSTGLFDRNTDGDISTAISRDLSFIPGGVDIAAGLNDLRSRFTAGQLPTVTVARFAVIITDGYDDPEPVADAAAELRAEDVTVIVVAPAGRSNRANLEAIATSPALVLEVPNFDDVADLLQSTIAGIDTDGDGTPDCEDACPTDPNKVVPGRCGCNEPDTNPCP